MLWRLLLTISLGKSQSRSCSQFGNHNFTVKEITKIADNIQAGKAGDEEDVACRIFQLRKSRVQYDIFAKRRASAHLLSPVGQDWALPCDPPCPSPHPCPSLTLPSLLPVPAPEPELYFCLRLSPGFPHEEVLRSSALYLIWPYWAFTFVFKFRLPKVWSDSFFS